MATAGIVDIAVLTPPGLAEEIDACLSSYEAPEIEVRRLEYDHASPAKTLSAIARFAENAPTIVHRADGLLARPLAPFVELLDTERPDMILLVAQGSRNAEPLGQAAQQILRVAELDPVKSALGIAGVCLFGPGAFGHMYDTPDALSTLTLGALAESQIARDGGRVQVRVVREWRAYTGDILDLLDMNRVMLDTIEGDTPQLPSEGNRFEGKVLIDPTASVTSSVICGPVIVGAGAYIADSYIGPHTSIGERVHLEGAEIERSIVFSGASILHIGGRLVASVVGRDARIFRDFSMPRAMRLQVGDGDEVALC